MQNSFRRTIILATSIVCLSAFAAYAAPAAADAPAATVAPAQPAPAAAGKTRHHPAQTIEQRMAALHQRLHITATQQPQWDAFAQVMQENAQDMEETFHKRVGSMDGMTAPQNMQSYADIAMSHAQHVQKLVPAFQALYDTMSDDQKKIADRTFIEDAHPGASKRHG